MPIELSKRVGVRLKPDDYKRLQSRAADHGLTVSDLIRAAALDVPAAPARRRIADQDLINQLSRIGNNLNQLTRLMHKLTHRGVVPETAPVLAVLEDVREHLDDVAQRVAEAAT